MQFNVQIPRQWRLGLVAATVFACFGMAEADAQQANGSAAPVFPGDLFAPSHTNLLGDIGGLRPALKTHGITLNIQDIDEVFGNATGGVKQGANYDGVTLMTLGVDTKDAIGLAGGTFNISGWQIRGRDLSTTNLLNLQTFSGASALPSTRLWEIWYQQDFLGGKVNVKIGQQALDQEFMTSRDSSLFVNAMMGWPMLSAADLHAGGSGFPLSSLGARVQAQIAGPVTLLAGAVQDNPPGGPFDDDSQLRGSSAWGGNFLHMNTGAFFIAELQYAINQPATGDESKNPPSADLPGVYKLGAWFDTAGFPSRRFDTAGLPLADPASNGIAQTLRNNFCVYALMDQMLWRPSAESPQALSVFTHIMAAPGDRNLISLSVNGGIALKAPLPGRDDDMMGLGFGIAQVSAAASGFDRDMIFFSGTAMPVRSTEVVVEATYQYHAAPWWQLQPDFQFVIRPGGGIPDPNNPTHRLGNEAVFGLRSVVSF